MSRRQRPDRPAPPKPLGDNWTNPFAGLKVDLPPSPPPPPPRPERPLPAPGRIELSPEDLELLKAFGGDPAELSAPDGQDRRPESPARPGCPAARRGFRLGFAIQRKGRGGRTVTLVRGLEALGISEQMQLCSQVKTALGSGAWFAEGVLEIQGDQRERAAAWLAAKGFPVDRPPDPPAPGK